MLLMFSDKQKCISPWKHCNSLMIAVYFHEMINERNIIYTEDVLTKYYNCTKLEKHEENP